MSSAAAVVFEPSRWHSRSPQSRPIGGGGRRRYADFQTITRAQTVHGATDDEAVIWTTARALLARALGERAGALRLMGVGVSGLTTERQLTLLEATG